MESRRISTSSVRDHAEAARRLPPGVICDRMQATNFEDVGRNVAVLTAAYLLDVAGMMNDGARRKIARLDLGMNGSWPSMVESIYGFDRTFLRKLYAGLLDSFLPHNAVAFILRGLNVPDPAALLDSVLSLND